MIHLALLIVSAVILLLVFIGGVWLCVQVSKIIMLILGWLAWIALYPVASIVYLIVRAIRAKVMGKTTPSFGSFSAGWFDIAFDATEGVMTES